MELTSTNLGFHDGTPSCTGASVSESCVATTRSLPDRQSAVADGDSAVAILNPIYRICGGWRSRLCKIVDRMGQQALVEIRCTGRRSRWEAIINQLRLWWNCAKGDDGVNNGCESSSKAGDARLRDSLWGLAWRRPRLGEPGLCLLPI